MLTLAMTLLGAVAWPSETPAAGPRAVTCAAVAPVTQVAIDLAVQQILLVELKTLYQDSHPTVRHVQRRVDALQRTLATLQSRGQVVDDGLVQATLDRLAAEAEAAVEEAGHTFLPSHPELIRCELRLQAIRYVLARRTLTG